jgi:hypothetical protein
VTKRGRHALVASIAMLCTAIASAHSASDAYLTLERAPGNPSVTHVQWDIALRDLDFVMRLDDDGDGRITWKELRRHQGEIARYALANIAFRSGGKACTTTLSGQLVDDHADGAYAALFFDVVCPSADDLVLDYRLFFRIDPSHRAIVVSRNGSETSTALLSPANRSISLASRPPR